MRVRWIGLSVVLAITMASSTFAPVIFSVLATTLREEFGAARWQIGALVAFNLATGAFLSANLGSLADRISPRRATVFTVAVAAAGFVFLAVAPSYWLFAAAGAVAGVAQGSSNPATNRLIMTYAPSGERGLLTGIKQAGVQLGTFLGGIALPIGAVSVLGWRGSVATIAAVPLVGLALVSTLDGGSWEPSVGLAKSPAPISRPVWRVTTFAALMGLATGGLFTYLSLYAQEDFGMTTAGGGALVAVFGGVGFVGRLSIGRLSERFFGHHRSLAGMALFASVAGFVLALANGPVWLWVGAVFIGLGAMAWNVVANILVMEVSPLAGAGRASGIMNAGFLAGMAIGPPAFGWSVDRLGTYRPAWTFIGIVAAVAAVVAMGVRTGSDATTSE